ncbi:MULTISPECIES: hypothetical protein [Pseudomonas syringae group]|uniref:hypothetical protein n=1 Tax=Pseudomonas syringae group TaxID=136849 RepID=UPI001587915D|nr:MULTISPECIES: hypothetical protein [Pseudomonas syringae group]
MTAAPQGKAKTSAIGIFVALHAACMRTCPQTDNAKNTISPKNHLKRTEKAKR